MNKNLGGNKQLANSAFEYCNLQLVQIQIENHKNTTNFKILTDFSSQINTSFYFGKYCIIILDQISSMTSRKVQATNFDGCQFEQP